MALSSDSKTGVVCDFCEKPVYRHVCIAARGMHYGESDPYRGWGFFEGHQRCAKLDRLKSRRAVKYGQITRYNYR